MIDQHNADLTGLARFSDDKVMRYRLARGLAGAPLLGADTLEVVNLFALRSPHPADLRKRAHGQRGDDATNDGSVGCIAGVPHG